MPWFRKTTWIRWLIHRAYKICSCKSLLSDELNDILKLVSWNGFPKRMSTLLIKKFSPTDLTSTNQTDPANNNDETQQLPKTWVKLPFIGKRGKILVQQFKKILSRLRKSPGQLIVNWNTTNANFFLSCKDKTLKEYQSSVVNKIFCPGCLQSYIGKTDRCL